ncbi:caspase family protein [Geodermatophilus sp. URMC 61]|uniref:caspase family protein n=1 Tax=Geodermatophilus sp. URMC 61 TaxID=3423411 RepID=UPI00406C57C2
MSDFAVVVGVARYPALAAEGVATDLDGPNNDALAVRDWLIDPTGGRLQPENVRLVRSADFMPIDPNDPQPARARIERELRWVEQQTADVAGNRLYLYFSGHGFSPVLEEGALFTADATQIGPEYVYAHAWTRWFRKAQRFRETVLWMDSCMNYEQSIPVNEVLMRPKIGTGVPGPAFIALAAQTKSALEQEMPDGQVHGVFTWTLLQGLRGGAADERGRVTGQSLRSFLYTVMPEYLPDQARTTTAVDLQPFIRADEGMVFQRLAARPKYPVRLVLPADAVGEELRIWTGRPLTRVLSEVLPGAEWRGELLRGLYVAEVPATGLRHGFQVSGAGAVEETVTRTGPPVTVPDASDLFSLDVEAGNPAAAVSVMDYRFERVFSETGQLHETELPGVYKIRIQFGRDITAASDEVVLLDRDTVAGPPPDPRLASPAPIPGTAATHEFHVAPFENAANRQGAFTGPTPGQSMISILARFWTDPGGPTATVSPAPSPHPMQGLHLVDADGRTVADLTQHCTVEQQTPVDPVAIWEGEVPHGAYFLRQVLDDGRQYEGCVIAAPDWVTQLAIQRTVSTTATAPPRGDEPAGSRDPRSSTGRRPGVISDVSVFMRRVGTSRTPEQDATIEAARLALSQGRNLFAVGRGAQLADLLLTEYTDPIAGIIGAHLLLRAMNEGEPDRVQTQQFDAAVANLRSLLGPDHPDVEALSLRCTDATLRTTRPFTSPPMFRQSWQLIAEASFERPELVPVDLWRRVHATVSLGAFFVWATDAATRAAHAAQLSHWVSQYAQSGEGPGAVPAAGAADDQSDRAGATAEGHPVGAELVTPPPAAASAGGPVPGPAGGRSTAGAPPATAASTVPATPLAMPAPDDLPTAEAAGTATLPEEIRIAASRLQVPATAAAALWAEQATERRGMTAG